MSHKLFQENDFTKLTKITDGIKNEFITPNFPLLNQSITGASCYTIRINFQNIMQDHFK
jgi:hypothetical protein